MSHIGEIILRCVIDLFFYTFCSKVGRQAIRILTLNRIHPSDSDDGSDFICCVFGFFILVFLAVGIVEMIRQL